MTVVENANESQYVPKNRRLGLRIKKSMFGLFERSPWEGTDAFYRMSK